MNTFEKRANELASNGVLPKTDYSDYIPKNKSVAVDENVAARKHDRNYSDLYGQTGNTERGTVLHTNTSSSTHWMSAEGQGAAWKVDANANERKSAFMKSDLDKEITPAPGVKDEDHGHRY